MTLQFSKASLEWFHQEEEGYFGLPSLLAQVSVWYSACPARSPDDVPDAVLGDDVVSNAVSFDDNRT